LWAVFSPVERIGEGGGMTDKPDGKQLGRGGKPMYQRFAIALIVVFSLASNRTSSAGDAEPKPRESKNAREVAEEFVHCISAGDVAKAVSLTANSGNANKWARHLAKRLDARLVVENVYADDALQGGHAFVVTKLYDHRLRPDPGLTIGRQKPLMRRLTLKLTKSAAFGWLVEMINFVDDKLAVEERDRFLKEFPKAALVLSGPVGQQSLKP
jgi:hypothetical protein